MDLAALLDQLRHDPAFMANVTAWERLPARAARYAEYPAALDSRLIEATRALGYSPLYIHQARAIEAALNGQNIVLVTGTASGKSLTYHLPALQFMLNEPGASALYLYPTKALAQDQAASLSALVGALKLDTSIPFNVYDGDTPRSYRSRIRRAGGVIISNPDMLHLSILPYHPRWATFFETLRVVVLDELHTYRGVFGSHIANVLRRLRRICRFYGSDPIFLCASATIANPLELAERLIEAPVVLIDNDGAPRGETHIVLYNPPTVDARTGLRRSYALEAAKIASRFVAEGVQTAIFARSRLATEVLLGYIRDEVEQAGSDPTSIRGYRGGYLPLERRKIEEELRNGLARGVVATNALELGIDIGELAVAILAGYPGTIASTWQQFGRAGRRATLCVGILVASGTPLDQYVATHPRYLFERSPEHALINPDNLLILADHLRCAAYELPFTAGEPFGSFQGAEEILLLLAEGGEIHGSGHAYRWVSDAYPAADVNLRTTGPDTIVIQDHTSSPPEAIGVVDRQSAPRLVHTGAIYLHEGRQFVIDELDWEHGAARASQTEADYYTDASISSEVEVIEEYASKPSGNCLKAHGRVLVTQQVTGYRIVKRYTHETLGYGQIDLPPQQFETTAYWVALTHDLTSQLEAQSILLRPNNYGPNWHEQRDRARARDGYRCTRCNAPERDGRQHDVHHLIPFRDFGYLPGQNENYREANRLDNLVTLCSTCHRSVEAVRGVRSALSGLSDVLQNVAALLLMCSPGDIGVAVQQGLTHAKAPIITIYDHAPGGLGLAPQLYDLHHELLSGALELVRDCPCEEGCPACVGPVGEGGAETKEATIKLLEAMVGTLPHGG